MKKLLLISLLGFLSSFSSAQVQLGGHIIVPSSSDSSLGQSAVVMTDADCTLASAAGCTVNHGPYVKTLYVTGTLTNTRGLIVILGPGREYTITNATNQVLNVGGATGTFVAIPAGTSTSIVSPDGTNYVSTTAATNVAHATTSDTAVNANHAVTADSALAALGNFTVGKDLLVSRSLSSTNQTTFSRDFIPSNQIGGVFQYTGGNYDIGMMTNRYSSGNGFAGRTIIGRIEHGGANIDGPNSIFGQQNYAALSAQLLVNTDGQIGGAVNNTLIHYGHGDGVLYTGVNLCTGVSRGPDEGCETWRVFTGFHGNNWGIQPSSIATNAATGEVSFQATIVNGFPQPSSNHDLRASFETGPIIDINPAKLYSSGNVALLSLCSSSVLDASHINYYGCLTGDSATNWSALYGTTAITTLTSDFSRDGTGAVNAPVWNSTFSYGPKAWVTFFPNGPSNPGHTYLNTLAVTNTNTPETTNSGWASEDRFASGTVCADLPVSSMTGITAGNLFTISSREDNFELARVLSVGTGAKAGTFNACLAKPHASGDLITSGGGLGYGIGFNDDDMQPNTVPGPITNPSIYRMVFPVIAVLPGNILMTTMQPFTQGNRIPTKALAANTAVAMPSATAVLNASGGVTGWTNLNLGGRLANMGSAIYFGGGQIMPPPALIFNATGCTTLPKAHYEVLTYTEYGWTPIIDTPGAGCTSVTVGATNNYANPYTIYPMAWARSNRDPAYGNSHPELDPLVQADPNSIMTASTSGFMTVGAAVLGTTGFEINDPIEGTYSNHQLISNHEETSRWVFDPGTTGDPHPHSFSGIGYYEGLDSINNFEPLSTYYGDAANHFQQGHGKGQVPPPTMHSMVGAYVWGNHYILPPYGNPGSTDSPSLNIVDCTGGGGYFPEGPCAAGHYHKFDLFTLFSGNTSSTQRNVHLEYDNTNGVIKYNPLNTGWADGTWGIQSPIINSTLYNATFVNANLPGYLKISRYGSGYEYIQQRELFLGGASGSPGFLHIQNTTESGNSGLFVYDDGGVNVLSTDPVYLGGSGTTVPWTARAIVGFDQIPNLNVAQLASDSSSHLAATSTVDAKIAAARWLDPSETAINGGLNAVAAGPYPQIFGKNETGSPIKITAIRCVVDAGASTCAVSDAGGSLLTGPITGNVNYATGTLSGNTVLNPGDFFRVTFTADGVSKQIGIEIVRSF